MKDGSKLARAFPDVLYVATDMAILPETHYVYSYYAKSSFQPEILKANYHEVDLNGKIYRRMSPRYLAWMGRQMEGLRRVAQRAPTEKAMEAFNAADATFLQVEAWCVWKFGEEAIRKEIAAMEKDKKPYRPPSRGIFICVGMAREEAAFLK